ncbi:RtcB family protein, partial [Pectobacterium brasiliense]|nr:RtcB family protein [Pectobacterium brasiliense]
MYNTFIHGAVRAKTRTAAKKRFTVQDQIRATAHVDCRKDRDVFVVIPLAFKYIAKVIAGPSSLVGIVHTLGQGGCG